MARYVGIKNNHIVIVSDKYFTNSDLEIIELPKALHNISNIDLIANFRYTNKEFKSKLLYKEANELKVAFVSNWKMQCGISTYFESLAPEIAKHIKEFKLFIEENDVPTGNIYQFGDQELQQDQVSVCWKRGNSLIPLAEEIKKYEPDVVLINHEWGIFPDAKHWLSFITQLSNYKVITILHSVFPNHKDKTICEAPLQKIIVHLDGAKQALYNKGIRSNIEVIPHGCQEPINKPKPWNFYKTNHNYIQVGFGFKYKGFEDSIIAVSLLKEKYPDIFFTAIFSEAFNNKNNHQIYYNELLDLIDKLDVKENVSIVRGFQSDEVMEIYMRLNNAAVLPYKSEIGHEVWGVSGSGRLNMTMGIPVISSTIPHFSDLPTIKTNSPQEIANALDLLFSNPQFKQEQIAKQNKYLYDTTWEKVALKFVEFFKN